MCKLSSRRLTGPGERVHSVAPPPISGPQLVLRLVPSSSAERWRPSVLHRLSCSSSALVSPCCHCAALRYARSRGPQDEERTKARMRLAGTRRVGRKHYLGRRGASALFRRWPCGKSSAIEPLGCPERDISLRRRDWVHRA